MANASETTNLISRGLQIRAAWAIVDDNFRPVHRQLNRASLADSTTSPGDESNFVLQFHGTS
jgi:hypothetical protein